MEKIIVNQDNKVWKDSSDRIIKTRPFSEDVLQKGLVFWGNSKPENLTIVNGLVSEAYDIRDTGHNWSLKMTQEVVTNRPIYTQAKIVFNGYQWLQSITNNSKSLFIVMKQNYGTPFGIGCKRLLGTQYYLGGTSTANTYSVNNIISVYYRDNQKLSTAQPHYSNYQYISINL